MIQEKTPGALEFTEHLLNCARRVQYYVIS